MTRGRRTAALLLLAAAFCLAALGQFYFFHRRDYLWDGLILHGLAVICFGLAWRTSWPRDKEKLREKAHSLNIGHWLRVHGGRTALMLLGIALALAATLLSQGRVWNQSAWDAIVLWLLGIASVALAAIRPSSPRTGIPRDWKSRLGQVSRDTWLELATVAAITLLAWILRVMALDRVPYTIGGDEAWHGLLARQVLGGELRNPFVMGYMSMPTSFYWPLSWSLRIVGNDVTGLRIPAAVAALVACDGGATVVPKRLVTTCLKTGDYDGFGQAIRALFDEVGGKNYRALLLAIEHLSLIHISEPTRPTT